MWMLPSTNLLLNLYNSLSQYVKELLIHAAFKRMINVVSMDPIHVTPDGHYYKNERTVCLSILHFLQIVHRTSYISKSYILKVEDIGVEPMTLCVQGRCSSQLS